MTEPEHPHADALKYEDWAGEMGARWLANLKGFEGTIAPMGEALLARAAFAPRERVIDLGCGGGATSIGIAAAVAPGGSVLGLDISPDLIAATTRRAQQAGAANAKFVCADAGTATLPEAPYDRLVSRLGCMFFSEPVAAFTNLRGQIKPGGRIDLAVWGPPAENPWMTAGMAVAREHVEMPAPVPRAPGPFAFEETGYLREVLTAAGFGHVDIVAATGELPVGGVGSTAEEARAFATNAMAFGQVLLDYPPEVQAAAAADLTALYARHYRQGEGVMMSYCAWLVSATA
ncbi:class I SAM-dependent methyltransferase [Novosphingobium album (ex Hu et al. 2023)]|uniref:Methyltransferase domain-containing protein n=1 Tax=Novosphingobium album (ex Hu et al. 2023) TaxID=2930093 RepID=A0ABT0AY03_9SPHN|nr:class I SAM-dependent methyltransferase [Novosphingobium album (ex Hu et al. 2023)]MCJ2177701.1 methyltransferase domain-containing protein [Novosphingobium album (ex Hu et al. 2023)]